ncbi:uncharacterized protein [Arachis hypogaea]
MVKDLDFTYEEDMESKDEEGKLSDEDDEADPDSGFEYSKKEDEVQESEDWRARRMLSKRKIIWDEDGYPNLIINKVEQKMLNKFWSHTLIVKLLGRRIGYGVLKKRLDSLWSKEGTINLIDVGNKFFLARFTAKEDYEMVLKEGPWMIFYHYLAVQRWRPDFNPNVEELTKITAWVRISDLPIEYYDRWILKTIWEVIGKTLKIDYNMAEQARGRFARICVKIDLTKPLRSKFRIKRRNVFIEYKGIHTTICFNCRRSEHTKDVKGRSSR